MGDFVVDGAGRGNGVRIQWRIGSWAQSQSLDVAVYYYDKSALYWDCWSQEQMSIKDDENCGIS